MEPKNESEYMSTGQVAERCSVTPDTVLKWVTSGKLPARRTLGGHCRIHRHAVMEFLSERGPKGGKRPSHYCWEFNAGDKGIRDGCKRCLVYRSRASRCFEMARELKDSGLAKLRCRTPCEECDFYGEAKKWNGASGCGG